jgi:thiol-disulfide isomerase/thioredoxin
VSRCFTSRRRRLAVLSWLVAGTAFPLQLSAQQADSTAEQIVASAVRRAQAEHKNVLVKFGASWCGWCHRFDRFLAPQDSAGRLMRDNFVIVPLTALESKDKKALETPHGNELLAAMGGKDAGLPWFYFLDQQGAKIGDSNLVPAQGNMGSNVGHPDTPQEVAAFVALLARVAPHMSSADRDTIRRFLTDMHAGVEHATPVKRQ